MESAEIRRLFLEFFKKKGHQIVPSAPLVLKNDPTLLFTNSGMVQFKDYFLGNATPKNNRIADTQKCLRVSGKHNDLEEVGIDTYHHTMFEMLGNWSFGDYFKKDAIAWAWELLTEVYKLPKDKLYVTVFGGDTGDNLPVDEEAKELWKAFIDPDHILHGSKKDNFWEMGESGPCGPCSEIHIDLRSDDEIKKKPGKAFVNSDHPQVVEIWNLVFMEFNRKADGSLEKLPAQHVDTGMGFERLCMAIQKKTSNYDTDVFSPLIEHISSESRIPYGGGSTKAGDIKVLGFIPKQKSSEKTDIALRVIADHIRAVSFAICDGQLPSNTGAGYVIRRILRRAVRYGFTFLNFKEPFLYKLVPVLAGQLKNVFPELESQKDYVSKIIFEEEKSFLRTIEHGMLAFDHFLLRKVRASLKEMFDKKSIKYETINDPTYNGDFYFADKGFLITLTLQESRLSVNRMALSDKDEVKNVESVVVRPHEVATGNNNLLKEKLSSLGIGSFEYDDAVLNGDTAFILYDTHGFPIDLTQLIAREVGLSVDMERYNALLQEQKNRSKADATKQTGDWISPGDNIIRIQSEDGLKTHTQWGVGIDSKPKLNEWEKPYIGFIGYDNLEAEVSIIKYRRIKQKNKEQYQLVFDKTPFYAESGGQVGDTGYIESANEKIFITDTKKENELTVHLTDALPENLNATFVAAVDRSKRQLSMDNHSATHLLHAALRHVLGKHVEQKGSLVNDKILRFDFSHFAAMTAEELQHVEDMVNKKIRANIHLDEKRSVPIEEAKKLGAMALFGEKYGDFVRVITFDPKFSVELCGGTHVQATGQIGLFKIISESSVAAGVRRIEAITADEAEKFVNDNQKLLDQIKDLLKNPKDLLTATKNLLEEKQSLEKKLEAVNQEKANRVKDQLAARAIKSNGYTLIVEKVSVPGGDSLKSIAYGLRNQFRDLLLILAADVEGKPQVLVMIGEELAKTNTYHAGNMVKELAKEIDGGGGGQPFFATAGGKNLDGLDTVLTKAKTLI